MLEVSQQKVQVWNCIYRCVVCDVCDDVSVFHSAPGPPRIDDAFDVFNGSNSYVHVTWRYPALPGGEITHFLISAGSGETLLDFSTVDAAENALSLENPESLNVSLQHRSRVQARSNSSHGISILAIKDVQSSEEQKDGIEFSEPVARDGQLCDGPSYPGNCNELIRIDSNY